MSIIQSGLNSLSDTAIIIQNINQLQGSSADTGGIFYLNHPSISVYVKNVIIYEPSATTVGGIAYI